MMQQDTICAIATAQGGAIGVIRVSGPEAISITSRIFTPIGGKPLDERKPYTLTFGKILSGEGEVIDEELYECTLGQDIFSADLDSEAYLFNSSMKITIREHQSDLLQRERLAYCMLYHQP